MAIKRVAGAPTAGFIAGVFAVLAIVFTAKIFIDMPTHQIDDHSDIIKTPTKPRTIAPIDEKDHPPTENCRLPQKEVFSVANFKGIGISPSEAQGADMRWENARMTRIESSEFVHGLGAASATESC